MTFCTSHSDAHVLFANEAWYLASDVPEQTFEGTIVVNPAAPAKPSFHRVNRYLLETSSGTWEIYTGGRDDVLAPFAGKRVHVIGKPVETNVTGVTHRELWPGRVSIRS